MSCSGVDIALSHINISLFVNQNTANLLQKELADWLPFGHGVLKQSQY